MRSLFIEWIGQVFSAQKYKDFHEYVHFHEIIKLKVA